jgi:hypothetical protein
MEQKEGIREARVQVRGNVERALRPSLNVHPPCVTSATRRRLYGQAGEGSLLYQLSYSQTLYSETVRYSFATLCELAGRQMLWKIVGIVAILACGTALGFWGLYGFPVPEKLSDAEFVTAVATLLIAIGTFVVAVVTYGQLKHNRLVERAYVKASPTFPGVSLGTGGEIRISLEIRNHGSTPARVNDVVMTADILPTGEALPEIPRYRRSHKNISTAFLVSNDYFFVNGLMYLDAAHVTEASQGKKQLFIFGYVDYIDLFEQRHLGGFARRYNHSASIRRGPPMQQTADWLEWLGMSEYAQRFSENRIDFSVLPGLTDQDLKDLGVVLGDRRKMLYAIAGAAPGETNLVFVENNRGYDYDLPLSTATAAGIIVV